MSSLRSMTGFGRAAVEARGWKILVEFRAVNQRGLDLRMFSPGEVRFLETKIGEKVRARLHRGRVEGRIELHSLAGDAAAGLEFIDEPSFTAVLHQLRHLSRTHGLEASPTLTDVLRFSEEILRKGRGEVDEETGAAVLACVDEALDALVEARQREGEGIARDFQGHLDTVAAALDAVKALYDSEKEVFGARLEGRVREALERYGVDLDEARLVQEIIIYAERSDVCEELQRARSHVLKLRELIDAGRNDEPLGKTIDFYLQELMREANTIASKSSSAALTDQAVAMKVCVEKMREQAANVE